MILNIEMNQYINTFQLFLLYGFQCREVPQWLFNRILFSKRAIFIETLIKEMKRVYTEKNEFEYQDASKPIAPFKNTRIKINGVLIDCFYKSLKFSLETSMKETKPVVLDKSVFGYGDGTLSVALIGVFRLSKFWCMDGTQSNFNDILLCKSRAFGWDFDGRNQTCSFWNIQVWKSRET